MPDSFAIQINCETTTFTSDLSVDHNLTAENHIGNEFDAVILKKRRYYFYYRYYRYYNMRGRK